MNDDDSSQRALADVSAKLEATFAFPPIAKRHGWQTNNRSIGRVFLEHALLIVDVMVAIEIACRGGRARLLSTDELPLRRPNPLQWSIDIGDQRKVGIIPDKFFALEFPNQSEDRRRAFYFLEADRGTMSVMRRNHSQSSFFRKLLAYEATWTQNVHRTRLACLDSECSRLLRVPNASNIWPPLAQNSSAGTGCSSLRISIH